jgi:transposase
MNGPRLVSASQAQLDELVQLAKTKTTFSTEQYALLEEVLGTFVYVMLALQNAKTSIKRFRQMLFGARTENKRKVLKATGSAGDALEPATLPSQASSLADATSDPQAPPAPPATPAEGSKPSKPAKPPPPGHGRISAQAYSNAPVVELAVDGLRSGDPCPECEVGKVYDSAPKVVVRVVGQPPLDATVYKQRRLRCRLCDAMFTAVLPDGAGPSKYDHSCASMLALLRYSNGMPFNRLQDLQASLNVPVPDATQFEIVFKAIKGPQAAHEQLIHEAAQAELLHNDDTPARILSLMIERSKAEAAGKTPVAKAINTSGIVAQSQGRKMVLFFTGHDHAGQNLAKVLAHRARELGPPMQMCDALAANVCAEFATILCNCLAHGRRQFVDVIEHFPKECTHVIEVLAKVYAEDAHCRKQNMSPEQRLAHHQASSGPPMLELHQWMNEQFDKRLVEPNSGLGKALRYMLKHWSKLTRFLHTAGAPLDNNITERALKRAIRHRRNSLFYKNLKGAQVGDIYMSLIYTCQLCSVNAFKYLQALQIHVQDVVARPALWMPWNYCEQLKRAA